jgi:transcription elongation factor GreA
VALKSSDGKEAYTIVGPAEASPREGRISNESPLGRTLLGRKVGESVTVSAPDGEIVYTITGIS